MTPKEKAKELLDRFIQGTRNRYEKDSLSYRRAKQCALIAVDEILNLCWNGNEIGIKYWKEVKQEIELIKAL